MDDQKTLRRALEVARAELTAAETQLIEVRDRVRNLRDVVYGLSSILEGTKGPIPGQAELFEAPASAQRNRSLLRMRNEIVYAMDQSWRSGGTTSATERAVSVLADAGRPMRMKDIRDEWDRRGWVDPEWKNPASAINMTYQRALRAGLVGRMTDGAWVLPLAVQDGLAATATNQEEPRKLY